MRNTLRLAASRPAPAWDGKIVSALSDDQLEDLQPLLEMVKEAEPNRPGAIIAHIDAKGRMVARFVEHDTGVLIQKVMGVKEGLSEPLMGVVA